MPTVVNTTVYSNPSNLGADTFSIPSTTAGNILVVAMAFNFTDAFVTSVTDGGDTFTVVPGSIFPFAVISVTETVAMYYTTTAGGNTSISFACGANPYIVVWEVTPCVIDDIEFLGSDSSAPVVGPVVNGSGTDIYFSVAATQTNSVTAVSSPWALDGTPNGNGFAHASGTGNQRVTFTEDGTNTDKFTFLSVSFKDSPFANACFNFQDPAGNPLAFGTVTFDLNFDIAKTGSPGDQVAKGRKVTALLDANGSVCLNLWPNTTLTSGAFASANRTGSLYFVQAFTAEGQPAWSGQMTLDASGNITWILQ